MVEDPNRAIQNRVFALLRLAVKRRGRDFLDRAAHPDQRLLDRTIQRLREDEVPGPITEGGVLQALEVAAAVLRKPPPIGLIMKRSCPACEAPGGQPCTAGGAPLQVPHLERSALASAELQQPLQSGSRDWIRGVDCPRCRAHAGERCRGKRGPRTANHKERGEAYRLQGYKLIQHFGGQIPEQYKRLLDAES